ncbi:MAG: L-lactate dehydrogenase [Bryobacteraceae bacterium]|nr:L-lactate dehydrogenase [Bryobacteraceae bacterium]
MTRRVAIIGTGWVGSSVAISTLHSGVADELLLNDAREEVAEGEAMDLAQGSSFYPSASVRTATIGEMADCDVVVVAAGRGGRPGESRLELLRDNVAVIRGIGEKLSGCRGTILMVTNPVDILTLVMSEVSGLPHSRVIGTGTMLDTTRLKYVVSQVVNLDPRSIHAYIVGEHGDSGVALWSAARVAGIPLRDWAGWREEREPELAAEVRQAAAEIIRRKGATNHAIGLVTADLLQCLLRDERRVLTVSRVQDEALELGKVALSLPAVVGAQGAVDVLEPEMSAKEREGLRKSADVLRTAAAEVST